ncbi:hypothetical protein C7T86_19985, partial [Xanthomonas citri pv. malvacearum]
RANILISTCSSTVSMALQKGQRLREAGQFEVAAVGQIKSAGDTRSPGQTEARCKAVCHAGACRPCASRPEAA